LYRVWQVVQLLMKLGYVNCRKFWPQKVHTENSNVHSNLIPFFCHEIWASTHLRTNCIRVKKRILYWLFLFNLLCQFCFLLKQSTLHRFTRGLPMGVHSIFWYHVQAFQTQHRRIHCNLNTTHSVKSQNSPTLLMLYYQASLMNQNHMVWSHSCLKHKPWC